MNNNVKTQEIVIGDKGRSLLGKARNLLHQLTERRLSAGFPVLKKAYLFGGVKILLISTDFGNKIIMWGGTPGQIFLVVPGDPSIVYLFDYIGGTITRSGSSLGQGDIHPFANGVCHLAETSAPSLIDNKYRSTVLGDILAEVAICNAMEFELLENEGKLYGRNGEFTYQLGDAPTVTDLEWLNEFAVGQGQLIQYPGYFVGLDDWNIYDGIESWVYAPGNNAFFPAWQWVPAIYFAEPGNALTLFPGFYYGSEAWLYGVEGGPFTDINVTFCCFVEDKSTAKITPYGWAELYVKATATDQSVIYPAVLSVFLQTIPPVSDGHASFLYNSNNFRTGGTLMAGGTPTFRIDVRDYFSTYVDGDDLDEVRIWTFRGYDYSTLLSPKELDDIGVMLRYGTEVVFFKYSGLLTRVMSTARFHSFSTSYDGSILCVFESQEATPGVISEVSVFDLFGGSAQGGVKTLQQSFNVSEYQFTTGCHIPFLVQDLDRLAKNEFGVTEKVESFTFEPYPLGYDPPSVPLPEFETNSVKKWQSPLLVINYYDPNATMVGGLTGSKIVCDDGIHARTVELEDQCYVAPVKHVRAANKDDEVTITVSDVSFTGEFRDAHKNLPQVLWSLEENDDGSPNEIVFLNAVVIGESPGGDQVQTLEPTGTGFTVVSESLPDITIGETIDGTLVWEHAVGELTFTGCWEEADNDDGYILIESCVEDAYCNGGEIDFGMTSSCGQEGSYTQTIAEPLPLVVLADDDLDEGDFAGATGGGGGYQFSMTGGSIDQDTGEILEITVCDTPGSDATVTITVEDRCGTTASKTCRVVGGSWVLDGTDSSPCYPNAPVSSSARTTIIGNTKYEIRFFFVISGVSSCFPCGSSFQIDPTCESIAGWSPSRNVTGDQYFGTSSGSTCVYCAIGPASWTIYKWKC